MRSPSQSLLYLLLIMAIGILLMPAESRASTERWTRDYVTQKVYRVHCITYYFETNKDTDDLESWSTKVYRTNPPYDEIPLGDAEYTEHLNSDGGGWYAFDCEWTPASYALMQQGDTYCVEVHSTWSDDGYPLRIEDLIIHDDDPEVSTSMAANESGGYPATYTLTNLSDTAVATFAVYTSASPCTLIAGSPPPCPELGTLHAEVNQTLAPQDSVVVMINGIPEEPYVNVEGWVVREIAVTEDDSLRVSESGYMLESPSAVHPTGPAEDFYSLRAVAPNPASEMTRVEFTLPSESTVRVIVADVTGREVARLADKLFPPGRHSLQWTLRGTGDPVSSGMYFIRLDVDGRTAARRVLVLP